MPVRILQNQPRGNKADSIIVFPISQIKIHRNQSAHALKFDDKATAVFPACQIFYTINILYSLSRTYTPVVGMGHVTARTQSAFLITGGNHLRVLCQRLLIARLRASFLAQIIDEKLIFFCFKPWAEFNQLPYGFCDSLYNFLQSRTMIFTVTIFFRMFYSLETGLLFRVKHCDLRTSCLVVVLINVLEYP